MTKALRESKYESPHAFAATYGAHREALELSEADFTELANGALFIILHHFYIQ